LWSQLYGTDGEEVSPRDLVTTDDAVLACVDGTALQVDLGGQANLTLATDSAVLARYSLATGDYENAIALTVDSGGAGSSCGRIRRDGARLVVAGHFDGTLFGGASQSDDIFLAEATLDLNTVTPIANYGDTGDETVKGLAIADDGHILFAIEARAYDFDIGTFTLSGSSVLPDPVVFDVNAAGTVTSARRYVGDNTTRMADLAFTRGGRVYVVGNFVSEVDVEGEVYMSNDITIATDVFFVRYGP
jgi:hypothetical protein